MSTAQAPAVAVSEPRVRERRRKSRRLGQSPWIWVAVILIILFCLFPFYWLINVSLKTGADLSSSSLVPPHPTLKNYKSIFENDDFTNGLKNSAIVAFSVTVLALAVGSFAAYALARLKLRGKFIILGIVLSVTTFPQIAIGATQFQAFRKVVVPLAAPGLATAGILTFIAAWNEFLLATTLTSSKSARTVPAAIAFFTGSTEFEQPLGTICAASVTISIPLIILVLLFQKRIVAGLTAGAVKG
jgi:multiple sugar transport system permease protein